MEIRKQSNAKIEVLIPDFKKKISSLENIFNAKPDIINHNIETVKELFSRVAPQKSYSDSLEVLHTSGDRGFLTKSGIMLGLGETIGEVSDCLRDLRKANVQMLTIGQYLQPTPTHYPVVEYIKKEIFLELKNFAEGLGFKHVESGPLVRSSYHAEMQAGEVL